MPELRVRGEARLLTEYFDRLERRNFSPNTIRNYRFALGKLLQTYPDISLEALTAEHIERHLYARPISPRSQATELRHIQPFFAYLVTHKKLLKVNPCVGVEPPKWTPRRRPAPSFADVEVILSKARTLEERVMVLLYFQTGLRLREVLHLKVGHLDIPEREVRVIFGKGGDDRVVYFDPPGLPPHLLLSPLLREFVDGRGPTAPLFPAKRSPVRSHQWVTRGLRRMGKEAGLPYRLSAHLLRHAWVRWAKVSGLPLPLAQKLLGHKDIRTTDRLYGQVDGSDLRAGVDRFLRPPK